jgi:hypothetical protein
MVMRGALLLVAAFAFLLVCVPADRTLLPLVVGG